MKNIFFLILSLIVLCIIPACKKNDADCGSVSNIRSSSTSCSSAIIRWDATNGATFYTIRYRQSGASVWLSASSWADSLSIIDLLPSTVYEYQLQSICSHVGSGFDATARFKTDTISYAVYIPSSFSPNGDGIHDQFIVSGSCLRSIAMQIYDRWGDTVFDSTAMRSSLSWDGTRMGVQEPAGTYVYSITLYYLDSTMRTQMGNVALIR